LQMSNTYFIHDISYLIIVILENISLNSLTFYFFFVYFVFLFFFFFFYFFFFFLLFLFFFFFFSSRRRHTRLQGDWSSDVCSSDLPSAKQKIVRARLARRRCVQEREGPRGG